jgi:hypothetical protein
MKNLVKIFATLGLIVAIALVLKGVFGVGKIGFKNLSSKTYIKFDRCYPIQDEYTNYTSFNEYFLDEGDSEWWFSESYLEIDLKKNLVVTTVVRSDEAIKKLKDKRNLVADKIRMETYPIISSSKTYIRTDYMKPKSNNIDLGLEYAYTFNLKEGYFEISAKDANTQKLKFTSMSQCEVY